MKFVRRDRHRWHAIRYRLARFESALTPQRRPPSLAPESCAVVRILGNDLYPRHTRGAMLRNLRLVLRTEPDLPGAHKVFVLNRLVDKEIEAEAERLIREAGGETLTIPFDPTEFAATGWNTDIFGGPEFFRTAEFSARKPLEQARMRVWACAPKVRYVMNVNGARNQGLHLGRSQAEWTVLLDGGCIFTATSFAAFVKTCRRTPQTPCVIVPMERLDDNRGLGGREPSTTHAEEPQIAFHCNTRVTFDERFIYGIRDKTSLLKSLGVPGPWHTWLQPYWLPDDDLRPPERFRYKYSDGGVFKLSAGEPGNDGARAQKQRYLKRKEAILGFVSALCETYGSREPETADWILQEDRRCRTVAGA